MDLSKVSASLKGFSIAALLIALGIAFAGIMGVMVAKKHLFTASLTGTGGVVISTPDNNSTVTSPVQVTASVASDFRTCPHHGSFPGQYARLSRAGYYGKHQRRAFRRSYP